ncbi:MAG TPA: hypothetical protein PKA91_17040, partial [Leptospiraceae bacterium]|nr:hypothetical protein [Leptospiraceae bacterium]
MRRKWLYEIIGPGFLPPSLTEAGTFSKEIRPLLLQKSALAEQTSDSNNSAFEVHESKDENRAIENILIRGDNLLALNAIKRL